MSGTVIATIDIKLVPDNPQDFYILILGGDDGICATGNTVPEALRMLANRLTRDAEAAAIPDIIAAAIRRSAELGGDCSAELGGD